LDSPLPRNDLILLTETSPFLKRNGAPCSTTTSISLLESNLNSQPKVEKNWYKGEAQKERNKNTHYPEIGLGLKTQTPNRWLYLWQTQSTRPPRARTHPEDQRPPRTRPHRQSQATQTDNHKYH
jgi:hypothetical protein